MSAADRIRAHAREHFVEVARRASQPTVTIVAGDVAKALGMSNRMPNVCQALGSRKFRQMANVALLDRDGPETGAGARFTYGIKPAVADRIAGRPPAGEPARRPKTMPRRETLPAAPPTAGFTAVIQCAARKLPSAGRLNTEDGTPILFVADPAAAPRQPGIVYRRPDDVALSSLTWREVLEKYNEVHRGAEHNPLGLLPAWRLYADPAYEHLVERLGVDAVFILSAGWGLIPATFLTPTYDITFATDAEGYKRRRPQAPYRDFSMLPQDAASPIRFLGSKRYVQLFCELTAGTEAERIVYHVGDAPVAPGCRTVRFETRRRTNWHYECARCLASSAERAAL